MTVQEESQLIDMNGVKFKRMEDGMRPGVFARKSSAAWPDPSAMIDAGMMMMPQGNSLAVPLSAIQPPQHMIHQSHPFLPPSLHRRGVSLDEARVHSGLSGGVVLVGSGGGVDSSGDLHPLVHPTHHHHSSQQHRRHQSAQGQQPYLSQQSRLDGGRLPGYGSKPSGLYNLSQPAQQIVQSLSKPEVKFVNSTVEILEDQIRKEEAPKKKRTRTTPEQLRILQKAFNADPMPNSGTRVALANKLGMNARAVQVWFQNRRAKAKLDAKRSEGNGRGSSGADSPHPDYDGDDGDDDFDEGSLIDDEDHMESLPQFRATNRSLKATGMVGRMAFPMHNGLAVNPNADYFGGLARSQSLPFLGQALYNTSDLPSLLDESSPMSLNLLDDTADSIPFAPIEFSAGSSLYPDRRSVIPPTFDYSYPEFMMSGQPDDRGNLARCQSLPSGVFEDAGLVDLLPPIDDTVWPTAFPPPPCTANVSPSTQSSQSSVYQTIHESANEPIPGPYSLRRSFSLPNVYQPPIGYYHGAFDVETDLDARDSGLSKDPLEPACLDDLSVLEGHHRRSRSHSISHHPDYPENVNDFLTVVAMQED